MTADMRNSIHVDDMLPTLMERMRSREPAILKQHYLDFIAEFIEEHWTMLPRRSSSVVYPMLETLLEYGGEGSFPNMPEDDGHLLRGHTWMLLARRVAPAVVQSQHPKSITLLAMFYAGRVERSLVLNARDLANVHTLLNSAWISPRHVGPAAEMLLSAMTITRNFAALRAQLWVAAIPHLTALLRWHARCADATLTDPDERFLCATDPRYREWVDEAQTLIRLGAGEREYRRRFRQVVRRCGNVLRNVAPTKLDIGRPPRAVVSFARETATLLLELLAVNDARKAAVVTATRKQALAHTGT